MSTASLLRRVTPAAAVALLVAACAGSAGAAGAAEPDPISVELGPFSVSSHGSSVVWSHFSEEPGLYELMTLRNGQRETLPVRPSPRPFDVDLGTSRSGSTVAVYSRCARLPKRPQDRGTAATCTSWTWPPASRRSSRSSARRAPTRASRRSSAATSPSCARRSASGSCA